MSLPSQVKPLLLGGNQGYQIQRSVRLRSSASAYLNRTPASAGNQKTWTWSGWVKLGNMADTVFFQAYSDTNNRTQIGYGANGINWTELEAGSTTGRLYTNAVYRDPAAWYHIVCALDTTQVTASNRMKLYVNGQQVTSFNVATYPAQNAVWWVNGIYAHYIARDVAGSTFDGYMTEVNFVDGQALTPSSFGSTNATTGVWQPAQYTGTYGTNGFYLNFSNNASTTTLGYDTSGNSNNWTTNNISLTSGTTYDSMTDVPTLTSATVANYAVANPIDKTSSTTVSDGNLKVAATSGWCGSRATFSYPSTGKYYWEATCISRSSGATVGILSTAAVITGDLGAAATGYVYNSGDGNKYNNSTNSAYGATWTTNDVIGIAWDADAGTLSFYKNGTSQGNAYTGLSGTFSPAVGVNGTDSMAVNFGQRPFTYTAPTGFVALNTYNLPASTIVKGNTVMDATLWTGDGTNPRTITNTAGFKPDLIWFKARSQAYDNALFDSVRGVQNYLISNATSAEGSAANSLQAFNSNGFQVGGNNYTNSGSSTYVGWQWQAGQGSSSTNTNGSITSTVSVNATAGFSVVTWTGKSSYPDTIGHGLGVTPSMIIVKNRNYAPGINWAVYHTTLGNTKAIYLNSTSTPTTDVGFWNNTSPTSTVFTTGNGVGYATGGNTNTYVAYCWSEVAGFSKFGSYTGNGSSDGPFVFTNFLPRWVMVKEYTTSGDYWMIIDTARDTYNISSAQLYPNASSAESSTGTMDILSNGFKLRYTGGYGNNSGQSYIYAAFASNPFRNSLAR